MSSRSSQHLNKLPHEPGVCLCLVGAQSSSNICLSVQANLYLLGKCVSVCVDVGVCVCGCVVGVFVCVQKQNKQPRQNIARITRVNDIPRPECLLVEQTQDSEPGHASIDNLAQPSSSFNFSH